MQELIVPAQDVFARHSARRNEQIRRLVSRGRPSDIARRRWCVVGASRFRLWQDAGAVLCDVISSEGGIFRRFDPGDPSASSPLALATTIDESDAVVSAGIGRADLPTVAGIEIPWITWVTNGQVPQRIDSARADAVILADARWRSAAEQKGWAAEQIFVAGWPALAVTSELAPTLSLIADTCRSATPDSDAMPLSSHRLMWEHVRDEIRADPFVLGVGMRAYLAERMRKFGIGSETLDQNRFIGQLVIPAYQQAVARVLVEGTIPIQIFGDGWHALEEFRAIARGPVRSRHDLLSAIGMSAALIHPLPTDDAHPIDAAPRPVIRPSGLGRQALIARARDAIKEFYPPARPSSPAIGCELIRTILRCI